MFQNTPLPPKKLSEAVPQPRSLPGHLTSLDGADNPLPSAKSLEQIPEEESTRRSCSS